MGYTYIVDSNQKLIDWANNVAGNDYTKVLIKSGTWESSVGVNLTTTGTKVVVGESDSLLKFNNTNYGLQYDSTPDSLDYYMTGVNVECDSGIKSCSVFMHCINLTNCTGSCICYAGNVFSNCINLTNCICTITSSRNGPIGFFNCTNLTNCTGTGKSIDDCMGFVSAFKQCTNLTNCVGSCIEDSRGCMAFGFERCTNLANCSGTGTTTSNRMANGFLLCDRLTNCNGSGIGNNNSGYGFNNCTSLTNCNGTGSGNADVKNGYGFNDCINLTNCTGTGTSTSSGYGYGFSNCKGVLKCKAGGNCSTSVFNECYSTTDGKFEVADTPAGGFNNTTNPEPV